MYKPAGGRPTTTNTKQVMEHSEQCRHVATIIIVQEMEASHRSIINHLHKSEHKKILDVLVPLELTQKAFWTKSFPVIRYLIGVD